MNLKSAIGIPLLCVPLLACGISITKESAREVSDVVIEGKVTSIRNHKAKVGTNIYNLTCAYISVTNVTKGVSVTNGAVTVYYETKSSNTFRCPPYVKLEVGDIGIFAATTNFQEKLGLNLFINSSDYVEIRTNEFKNANKFLEDIGTSGERARGEGGQFGGPVR